MIELILILISAILTGIAIGLFPVFPIYLGAFVLYFVGGIWDPEHMLLFWAVASIGSQFFGSVSAITLGIPGDASSTIYIDHVKNLSLSERNQLLWSTARGSLISGSIALIVVWSLYHSYVSLGSVFLTTVNTKIVLLSAVVLFTIILSKNKLIAVLLAVIGLAISPTNNYALPIEWYRVSIWFEHTTFFMLILGLMIIPDLLTYQAQKLESHTFHAKKDKLPWWLIIKNSVIGCLVGSVPGPAAETATAVAYSAHHNRSTKERIIAAETANNPGVIMMLLPFFLIGIPFTPSSLVVSNIMDTEIVDVIDLGQQPSLMLDFLTVFDTIILLSLVSVLFYYALSIRFINFYVHAVSSLQHYLKSVLVILMSLLVFADAFVQEITIVTYLGLMTIFIGIGLVLKYFRISPIPLIFVYILGDQLIWSWLQFVAINF